MGLIIQINSIGFLPFYEMGRNFAIFNRILRIDDKKHNFNSEKLMSETTKSLNYPYAADEADVPMCHDGTLEYHGEKAIEDLKTYLADKSKNSQNTLLLKQDHKGEESYKLMRSFLFYIAQNYGGYDCIKRMWSSAPPLGKPETPQDVLDNYFLIACFGAQTDLTRLFERNFKYFLSDRVKQDVEAYAKDSFKF
jgi:hypothetical protein